MTKKYNFTRLAAWILCAVSMPLMWANPITETQAQRIAGQFMAGKVLNAVEKQASRKAPRQGSADAAYYVFNTEARQGYVIVAGDDRVPSILGYSDNGTFDPNDVPPAMQAMLDGYAEQIESLSRTPQAQPAKLYARPAIAPLLTCIWGQGEPFNIALPFTRTATSSGVTRAYHGKVGCVATAMAQVMYYNKWPNTTNYPIPAYTSKSLSISMPELPVTTFDWSLLKDSYNTTDSTTESGAELAKFNLYCAQSLEMDFQKSSSSASTSKIPSTLVTYFDYSPNMRYILRESYSTRDWEDILYNELQAKRPVVYRGDKNPGGHAFVCDGCDNTGLFHINWGWNSLSNGYFVLSDLNPDAQGIGGSDGECGYIYGQGMVIGIKPNDHADIQTMVRFYTMVVNSSVMTRTSASGDFNINVSGRFLNCAAEEEVFDYGWALYQGDNMLGLLATGSRTNSLQPNYYFTKTFDLAFGHGLANGTYTLRPVFSELDAEQWQLCVGGSANYIEVTINGNECSFATHGVGALAGYEVSDMTFEGTFHTTRQVDVTATLTNKGNTVGNIIYLFVDGEKTTSALCDLDFEQTGQLVYHFTPAEAGVKTITLSLNEDGVNPLVTRTVTITDMPAASLTITNKILNVTDATNKIITSNMYSVESTIKNTGTTDYNEDVSLRLYRVSNGTSGTNVQDVAVRVNIPVGETQVVRFDCPNVVSGEKYFAWVYYFSAGEQIKAKGTSSHTLIIPDPVTYKVGDVNGNGTVDVEDVNILINIMLSKDSADNYDGRANVDGQDDIDISDVNVIINIMLGR